MNQSQAIQKILKEGSLSSLGAIPNPGADPRRRKKRPKDKVRY